LPALTDDLVRRRVAVVAATGGPPTAVAATTVGIYNFLVGRADLPEDLVYKLIGSVLEAQPLLIKAHSSAREMLPEKVDKDTFLPFHPGAVRYYREIGIKIPDELAPDELIWFVARRYFCCICSRPLLARTRPTIHRGGYLLTEVKRTPMLRRGNVCK
jgi:NMT1-like family